MERRGLDKGLRGIGVETKKQEQVADKSKAKFYFKTTTKDHKFSIREIVDSFPKRISNQPLKNPVCNTFQRNDFELAQYEKFNILHGGYSPDEIWSTRFFAMIKVCFERRRGW